MPLPVIVIMGPTSSGKTALGIRLAKIVRGEVINADARQLYRDAPIGTGIPPGERHGSVHIVENIPHHLLGVCGPDEHWSVVQWVQNATRCIEDIHRRGHIPVLVGGTGLYLRALTEGYTFSEEGAHPEARARVMQWTPAAQLEELLRREPSAAHQIDVRNPYRVQRALERVIAGQPLRATAHRPPWPILKLVLWLPPEELAARVQTAVRRQLSEGWIEEVEALLRRGTHEHAQIFTVIGFRVLAGWVQSGKGEPLSHIEQQIVRETWQYVRRQVTWLRKEPSVHRVSNEDEGIALARDWLEAHGILLT